MLRPKYNLEILPDSFQVNWINPLPCTLTTVSEFQHESWSLRNHLYTAELSRMLRLQSMECRNFEDL